MTAKRLSIIVLLTLIGTFSLTTQPVVAETKIAVVGKTKNDSFYQQSFKGCQAFAARHSDIRCIYDGPQDYQDIRSQANVVNALIDRGIDALMISTTDSHFLTKGALHRLKQLEIPVITFDSDLLPEHQTYRIAYVGTDNFDFGQALGHYVNALKIKSTNRLCLQSGHQTTPNLNARIAGVRFALSGQTSRPMNGEQGWYEHPRCPLYSLGKRDVALAQLEGIIRAETPPIFLAVAGFAQFNKDYIPTINKYKKAIAESRISIISADTEAIQLVALKKGLSTANIGQKPFEMGRLSAELLYNYLIKNELPKKQKYYLDYHYCHQNNADTCTVNY